MSNWFSKLQQVVLEELNGLNTRVEVVSAVGGLIPPGMASGFRTRLLGRAGFSVGEGTVFHGQPRITGNAGLEAHLTIGRECVIELECTFDLQERITIEDRVTLGHQVMILTSTHELGPPQHRAGPVTRAPVTIKSGAWLGPRCIVLPGVTIGEGAIVMPGSLVNKDVAPNTRVSGTPARVVETLT